MASPNPFTVLAVLQQILDGDGGRKPEKRDGGKGTSGGDGIVSRRDERGVPYRGDFPNPASDVIRGCF
jgi:hypothetical protein